MTDDDALFWDGDRDRWTTNSVTDSVDVVVVVDRQIPRTGIVISWHVRHQPVAVTGSALLREFELLRRYVVSERCHMHLRCAPVRRNT